MSVVIKSGSSGNLANVDVLGNLSVAINGSIALGNNIIGQVKITDGANVLGTITNPLVTSTAPPQDIIVTGTIASSPTANVSIGTQGAGTVKVYISGSWGGALQFEASPDGVAWNPAVCFPKPSSTAAASSTTANGVWAFAAAGAFSFRVRASAWSTGMADVFLEATQASGLMQVYNLYAPNLLTKATCVGTLTDEAPIAATQNMGVLTSHATAFAYAHPQDTVGFLHSDLQGNLRTRNRSESILGDLVVIPRLNQIEINFSESGFNPDLITCTSSGGGGFTVANGTSIWFTGTAITGHAHGVTTQQLQYHPGHEWYAKWTSGFTTPTDAFNPNYQRIGPYNATDGFFIGYEKTLFCCTHVQNSVVTSVPKSAWNGDPVDGSTNSAFTRRGVPEALDFQNINIFRIRGSWFGTAPVELQVFSPDLDWITLHTFTFPNTVLLPYTFTTNWNMQIDVFKSGSDSTDLQIKSPCIAMGTNNDTASINEPLTDYSQAKLVRAVLTGKNTLTGDYDNVGLSTENAVTVSGSGKATLDVAVWDNTTPQGTFIMPLHNDYHHNTVTIAFVATSPIDTGAITFEASIDDIHYLGITGVNIGTGLSMPSSVVAIQAGTTQIYTFNVSGFNHFRYRLSTAITNTGTLTSSYLLQGLSSPSVSTTITTGTINVDSNQGTPTSLGNAWPMGITDGVHGPVAVKGPSTGATGSDPALVVAISPNSSLAVTGTFWQALQPVSGTVAVTQSTSLWITSDNHFTHNLNQDGSGNVGVNVQNFPASQTVSGSVTAQLLDSGGANKASIDASGRLAVKVPEVEFTAGATGATTAVILVGGKSADGTPVYNPIPLAAGSGSVIVSGTVGITGAIIAVGNLTNNNAAPAATNIGALTALANAVAPTWTEGNQVALSSDLGGNLRARTRPGAPVTGLWSHAIITVAAASGTQTLIAGATGATIRVMKLQFTTDKSTNVSFLDNTPTTLSGTYVLTGNGSSYADSGDGEPLWVGGAGKAFQINLSATATLGGDIWFTRS